MIGLGRLCDSRIILGLMILREDCQICYVLILLCRIINYNNNNKAMNVGVS